MRRWTSAALLLLLVACSDDGSPTVVEESTTSTTAPTAHTCARPAFQLTWVPDPWLLEGGFLPGWEEGSGGGGVGGCVFHVGEHGRFVDLRAGDGGFSFGDESRTITVLGRDATIGPIHEGFMVRTDSHALLGYGISEDDLARLAEGLYFTLSGVSVEERPIVDGTGIAQVVELTAESVTFDPTAEYTCEDALVARAEHGFTADDCFNDHVSANDDATTQTLPLATDGVAVTSPWAAFDSDTGCVCQRGVSLDLVLAILADESHPQHLTVQHSPWWITVHDGVVTRLDQQYLP